MLEIVVIGIGTGNPEHMTVEAIRALNAADLVLIPRKGAAKADLAELRREICDRYLDNPATRHRRVRHAARATPTAGYRDGVEAWHRAIAGDLPRAARRRVDGHASALLVWGDPSLYDSTLRILDHLAAGGLAFTPPGGARASPACRCWPPATASRSTRSAAPVHVTTGRRLREARAGRRTRSR